MTGFQLPVPLIVGELLLPIASITAAFTTPPVAPPSPKRTSSLIEEPGPMPSVINTYVALVMTVGATALFKASVKSGVVPSGL